MANIAPTRDFIAALFEGMGGWFEIRAIKNKDLTQHFFPLETLLQDWPKIEEKVQAINQGQVNIYFGLNPRTDKIGDADHVKECRLLWADIDYKDGELLKKNAAPLKGFNLYPSIIVSSGNGYHLYWLLKEPMDTEGAGKIMREVARVLGGDTTYDSSRVLRVPDTINWKDPTTPKRCSIVWWEPSKRFTPLDFEVLSSLPNGESPKGKVTAADRPSKDAKPLVQPSQLTIETYGNGHGFAYSMARTIAPYWTKGVRHKLATGLAGLLRKDTVTEEGALLIVHKVAEISSDDEVGSRLTTVKATYAAPLERIASSSLIEEALGKETAGAFFKAYNIVIRTLPPPPVLRKRLPTFNLYQCIPSDSLFDRHIEFAASRTDAPLQYHAAAILTLAAGAIGNKVSVLYHGKLLYPTLYTLLVGASSRYRKSSAVSIAHSSGTVAKVKSYSSNATVEQLYTEMADQEHEVTFEDRGIGREKKKIVTSWRGEPSGIIYYPEFGAFLDVTKRSYMADLRMILTNLYDGLSGPDVNSRKTKTSGKYIIERPSVSILGGVTLASVKAFVSETDMSNGFLSRFFVVMPDSDHQNSFEDYDEEALSDIDKKKAVVDRLEFLTQFSGKIKISPEAKTLKIEFAKKLNRKILEYEGTDKIGLDPFLARLEAMAVKIGMIYAVSTRTGPPEISGEDMRLAVNFCTYVSEVLEFFFEGSRPDNGNRDFRFRNAVLETARGIVKRHGRGPIPHRTLLQYSNITAEQFKVAVDGLVEEGRLCVSNGARGGKSYRLNELEAE